MNIQSTTGPTIVTVPGRYLTDTLYLPCLTGPVRCCIRFESRPDIDRTVLAQFYMQQRENKKWKTLETDGLETKIQVSTPSRKWHSSPYLGFPTSESLGCAPRTPLRI